MNSIDEEQEAGTSAATDAYGETQSQHDAFEAEIEQVGYSTYI